jgi:hypothetical protein
MGSWTRMSPTLTGLRGGRLGRMFPPRPRDVVYRQGLLSHPRAVPGAPAHPSSVQRCVTGRLEAPSRPASAQVRGVSDGESTCKPEKVAGGPRPASEAVTRESVVRVGPLASAYCCAFVARPLHGVGPAQADGRDAEGYGACRGRSRWRSCCRLHRRSADNRLPTPAQVRATTWERSPSATGADRRIPAFTCQNASSPQTLTDSRSRLVMGA